jgi:hypothetical protein
VIEVELPDGTIVEFPDGTAPDVMKSALQKRFGSPQPAPEPEDVRGPSGVPGGAQPEGFVGRTTAEPEPLGMVKSAQYGLQNVGSGLAAIAGTPVDLMTGAQNTLVGINNLFADNPMPYVENPVGGSQSIKDFASSYLPTIDDSQVPDLQRLAGSAVDYGTQAATSAGALALRAPAAMARASRSGFGAAGSGTTQALDRYARPYANNPLRTMAGDTAAGAGSGVAIEGYDDSSANDAVASLFGQTAADSLGTVLAGIVGGTGGALALSGVQGLGQAAVDRVRKPFGGLKSDYQIGNLTGGDPITPTKREMEIAASEWQARAFDKEKAQRTLEANNLMLEEAGVPVENRPTSSAMSGDTGLARYENALRTQDSDFGTQMIERDKRVRTAVGDKVRSVAPAGSDGRQFTDFADAEVNRRIAQAEDVAAQDDAMVRDMARDMETRTRAQTPAPQDVPVRAAMADMANASKRIDEAYVGQERVATAEKNADFDDPEVLQTPVSPQRAIDAADAVEQSLRLSSDRASVPSDIIARIRNFAPDSETGESPPMTFADVQEFRAQISDAIGKATAASGTGASGSGPMVRNLKSLRDALGGYEEDIIAQGGVAGERVGRGQATYREKFVPRFKEGESGAFRRELKGDPNRQRLKPEDTAGRFLGRNKGSDVESLNRAVPDNAADARTWLIGRLGESGVVDEKTKILRPDTLRSFATKNREVIVRVPGMQKEIDDMLAQATQGQEMTGRIRDDLRAIETARTTSERATGAQVRTRTRKIENSPLGKVVGNDPVNAAQTALGSGDPERAMRQLVLDTGPNEKARDGLKRAVSDWLNKKITTSRRNLTGDDTRPVSGAKIENVFSEHEKALAEVFSAEEMNALRVANDIMDMETNRTLSATSNSATAERGFFGPAKQKVQNAMEAGLKLRYGALKGGGIMRSLRLAAESLPDSGSNIDRIIAQAQSDPELAMHLFKTDVSKINTPDWNAKLNRLLSAAAGVREGVSDDGNEEVLTIDLTPSDVKK